MSERDGIIEEGETYEKTYEEREIEWKVMDILFRINSEKVVFISPSFSFASISWQLELYPKSVKTKQFMCLYLTKKVKCIDYSVDYTYGLKKLDGSVEHLGGGIFEDGSDIYSDPCHIIKLPELVERKSELAPSDVLTLTCLLKRRIPNFQQPSVLDTPKLKKLMKLNILSENFKEIFTNKESCDTTLYVKDKEYSAHKTVLIARSPVLAAMFKHDTKEKQTGTITIPDCDPDSFKEFLEYLYCGELEMPSPRCALHLYETSDKYDAQELKTYCKEYLMENLTVEDFSDIVIMVDKYDEAELFSAAQDFFNKNLTDIWETSAWECLMRKHFRLGKKLMIEMSKGKAEK